MTQLETIVKRMKPVSIKMIAEGNVGARLVTYPNGAQVVMKICSSVTTKNQRTTQRGLPTETEPKREVAFYRLCKLLGWDIVPETVLGEFAGFPASFQQYMTAAKLYDVEPRLRNPGKNRVAWQIALRETLRDKVPFEDTLRLTVLDFLAGSRDRHAANYGVRLDVSANKARWRLIGWDNGCSFGLTQALYKCVAHKWVFRYAFDLSTVWDDLRRIRRSELASALSGLIDDEAIDHVWHRVQFVLTFPHRMPWKTLSQGHDDGDSFPSYAEWFKPMLGTKPFYILQTQAL